MLWLKKTSLSCLALQTPPRIDSDGHRALSGVVRRSSSKVSSAKHRTNLSLMVGLVAWDAGQVYESM